MKYLMIIVMVAAIFVMFISIVRFLHIKHGLKSTLYCSDFKIMIVSDIYIVLLLFFLIAYIVCTLMIDTMLRYGLLSYIIISLLFFGSIFVGLSILFLKCFIDSVIGIKKNHTDTMTGLLTKDGIEIVAQELLDKEEGDYVLAIIDLDNFKKINDLHGHAKGDEVIKLVSDIIKNTVRVNDIVGRFGGDEFIIIFKDIELYNTYNIMYRIEASVINSLKEKGCNVCTGISYGIVKLKGNSKESYKDLFEKADKSLYKMKYEKKQKINK